MWCAVLSLLVDGCLQPGDCGLTSDAPQTEETTECTNGQLHQRKTQMANKYVMQDHRNRSRRRAFSFGAMAWQDGNLELAGRVVPPLLPS